MIRWRLGRLWQSPGIPPDKIKDSILVNAPRARVPGTIVLPIGYIGTGKLSPRSSRLMLRATKSWKISVLLSAIGLPSFAQNALDPVKVCGPPDETITENVKGDLKGTAQTLAKLGTIELQGNVEKQRNRIIIGKERSDALRELHYLNSVSCC
jgi:hypothetical protein